MGLGLNSTPGEGGPWPGPFHAELSIAAPAAEEGSTRPAEDVPVATAGAR